MGRRCDILTVHLLWLSSLIVLILMVILIVFGLNATYENCDTQVRGNKTSTCAVLIIYSALFTCVFLIGIACLFIATPMCIKYTYNTIYDKAVEQVKANLIISVE